MMHAPQSTIVEDLLESSAPMTRTINRATSLEQGWALSEVAYAPNAEIEEHSHEWSYLCLTAKGAQRVRAGGDEAETSRGAALFHRAGEVHGASIGPDGAQVFHIGLPEEMRMARPVPHERLKATSPLLGAAVRIYREWRTGDLSSKLEIDSICAELRGELRSPRDIDSSDPPWLGQVADMLHAHATKPLRISCVSDEVGLDRSHVARSFRQRYGCSIGQYHRRVRLVTAAQRLANDEPIARVAARTGFADQSHFTRIFRREMGVTPGEYVRCLG